MLQRASRFFSFLTFALSLTTAAIASPQQARAPLTNADVIKMVKAGLPEGTVVSAIQASPTNFDISPDALISVKAAGVPESVLNAMITADSNKRTSGARGNGGDDPGAFSGPLHVELLSSPSTAGNAATQGPLPMPAEKTQLAETTTKAKSLGGLAADGAVSDGLQTGVDTATWEAMNHSGAIAGVGESEAGSVLGSFLSHRDSSLTYVWAVQGANSANTNVPSTGATFSVHFSGLSGVNPDDYEPILVKLTSTLNNFRLVGASQGKESEQGSSAVDWQVYANFVEDRVPAKAERLGSGDYHLSPIGTLVPGEYAVVLRPISKSKKFSGSNIAGNIGDGLIFNTVWSFEIK